MHSRGYSLAAVWSQFLRSGLSPSAILPSSLRSQSPVNLNNLSRRILLCAITLTAACAASAQTPAPPSLDEIVQKLQSNLDAYDDSIPSFMADEHIDSIRQEYSSRGASSTNYESIIDSVFRLKRQIDPADGSSFLNESRDVKVIDGRPANGRAIDAPAMLVGAFSGGLAFVSRDEQICSRYTLEPIKRGKPIVVRFVSVSAAPRPKECILREDGSGSVTVDPVSMQITRIEVRVPRHLITPQFSDGHSGPSTLTHWDVEVDYRPVDLDARPFWLPATIRSTRRTPRRPNGPSRHTYRNYHKLEVRSRILPSGEEPKQ